MNKDYYAILQIEPSATKVDIQKKYFKLAKLYHPDVTGDISGNKDKFKLINEAYSILGNPQKRREYDESLKKGSTSWMKSSGSLRERNKRTASVAYEQAKTALRYKSYEKAALLLKSAVKNDPSIASYHSWYGFALAMSGTNLHEARDECRAAVQMEFYNPDFRVNLGLVYFKAGLKKQAMQHFRDALQWDPTNKLAEKYMSKMETQLREGKGPIDKFIRIFKKGA